MSFDTGRRRPLLLSIRKGYDPLISLSTCLAKDDLPFSSFFISLYVVVLFQAIWFTEQTGVEGPVFGSNDNWKGLGVFLDSFDNDALVSLT